MGRDEHHASIFRSYIRASKRFGIRAICAIVTGVHAKRTRSDNPGDQTSDSFPNATLVSFTKIEVSSAQKKLPRLLVLLARVGNVYEKAALR